VNVTVENWLVTLIATIVTAVGSFAGVYFSNRKSQALMEYRIGQLENKMDKHNNMIERVFNLEGRMNEAEHDIRDMKSKIA
jgi:hypothetical protein